jgi:hypothetical protein
MLLNENIVIDLGWCIARLELAQRRGDSALVIVSPSDNSVEVYEPPQSIRIYGLKNIRALHRALDKHLPPEETGV